MPESPHIVIAGGGAIGLSVAYHLGLVDTPNVTLAERNRLTSGTSWHAAGIVGPLRSSQNLTALARYGIDLFSRLEKQTGTATGYQRTGGLWLAQSQDRLHELDRVAAMAELNGLHATMLDAQRTKQRLPLLYTDDLAGALWVDEDGQINPVDLCMAYAKGARDRGVNIIEHAAITDVVLKDNALEYVVINNERKVRCDIFINCAGLWARKLGLLAGVNIPLQAVEHSYLVSEPLPGLPDPCPIVRDLDNGFYLKGDAGKLLFGAFEPNAKLWSADSVETNADYLMFAEDWEHVAPLLNATLHRVPTMSDTGVQQTICGPESFTLDTRQLMGESAEIRRYYVAAGFNSIGIMSSAGVGRAMAEWVLHDKAPMDLWDVDIQRFAAADNLVSVLSSRIPESVHNQFALHWPGKQFTTARDRRLSPWHNYLARHHAVFGAPAEWERPLWYSQQGKENYSYQHQPWWPYARHEAQTLQKSGALFELSPFTKVQISGKDALAYLQYACTRDMDVAVGKVVYTLLLNDDAGIELECTVTRLSVRRFLLVSGAATRTRDMAYLRRQIEPKHGITIEDVTESMAALGVAGPRAWQCLEQCTGHSFSSDDFPCATAQWVTIAGCSVLAVRVSYSGEAGWELYIENSHAEAVLEHVHGAAMKFNMVLAGHYCLDSCRLEKGYPHWGHDIGSHDTPVQAGLMSAVAQNKVIEFRGRTALQLAQTADPQRQRILLHVDAENPLLLHDEPVFRDGVLVGASTSGGLGFRTAMSLSMAMVDVNADGSILGDYQIKSGRELLSASVLQSPPYDPTGMKLRQ